METALSIYYLNNDYDDLGSFQHVAEKLGNTVSVFRTGNEMLQALRNRDKLPNVIFLDTHMPIINGVELMDLLKKSREWKNIPLVIVSGAFPKKLARHFMEMGASYLMKKHHNINYTADIEQVLSINLHNVQAVS